MTQVVQVPDFDWAAFYYADILDALIRHKRKYLPELTDESEFEPLIQMLRAFALVGHLNNGLLDIVANEGAWRTAKLRGTVRNMAGLLGEDLAPAAPAEAELLMELSAVLVSTETLARKADHVATRSNATQAARSFEVKAELSVVRTDQLTKVHAYDKSADTTTDFTAKANSPTTPADDWNPWPVGVPSVGDVIYFGHSGVMWNKLAVALTTPASGLTGVWECYDGVWEKTSPTSVTDLGGTLEFDLTALLGTSNRSGTLVRVTLGADGSYEEVLSTYAGGVNKVVTGLLGQASPSTVATAYFVGTGWLELSDVTDGTSNLQQNGDVSYTLPQSVTERWAKGTFDSHAAFFLRYRLVAVSAPSSPVLQTARIDTGKQYAMVDVVQGRTKTEVIGSSDGTAEQSFTASLEHYVAETMAITIAGETWLGVDDFLSSRALDRHFVVELGDNDRPTVVFGNGTNGRIPPVGVNNVSATYRYGANENGNVGANTIVVDKAGLPRASKIWNPRAAAGWAEAEGVSDASLERAKVLVPARWKTREVALNPLDLVEMVPNYADPDTGAKPFSRVRPFENAFGPKTVELALVAKGGGQATAAQLLGIETYFNGDDSASPPKPKRFVANQQVVASNFTGKAVNVTMTVYGNVTEAQVKNALAALLHPEAVKEDGVTWEWDFGGKVPVGRIEHEVWSIEGAQITNVVTTTPAADVSLLTKELPINGTFTITIVSP